MAKITLDTIESSFASTSLFNTNYTAIADNLNDKVLYRTNPSGEANEMMNDLDMNSNSILNTDTVYTDSFVLGGQAITGSESLVETDYQTTTVTLDNTFDSVCTLRVSRLSNIVTVSPDAIWGSAAPLASSYQSTTGVIPSWARPEVTIVNTCWTGAGTFAHFEIAANGRVKISNINVAGIGQNIDTDELSVCSASYCVEV